MKKEKSVKSYQRKSKNGKVVTVHSYKAKYDAAEEARKEMAKRAGAGDELKKKKSAAPADLGFTADEFKIWANDLDVEEAKRIDKILVKKYGEKAVQKLADEINAGNSRTYKAVFARLSSEKPKESKKDRVVDDFLSGKDVSKQLTEKKSSRKITKVGNGEYQTGMKVANKKLSAKEQKLVDKILDENKGELDKEYLEAFYPEVSKKVHEAVIKAQSAKSLKEKPVKKVAIKTANSLPEIKIPEKPKLRDKNFSSKISDYNAALDYRDYREAVLRGDKKAIADAKYNLTGYLREEADSTSLTQRISKLTGIPLGASRDASKSSEKTTKTKVSKKQPMPKFNDSAIQRVANNLGVSKQTAQKKMYAELQRRLDSGMSMGKAISTPLFPDTPAKEERKKYTGKKVSKNISSKEDGSKVSGSSETGKKSKSMPTKSGL